MGFVIEAIVLRLTVKIPFLALEHASQHPCERMVLDGPISDAASGVAAAGVLPHWMSVML